MPRRRDLLHRISVTAPCTADWDSMVGNEQVRFCTHCNLDVHNLSSMTRTDARRLVRKLEGRVCVRYYRRPDGSLHTLRPAARLHQIQRRASTLAAGAFGAVLTLGAGAAAQTGPQAGVASQHAVERVTGKGAALTGTVFDPHGAVVPNAEVIAFNTDTWHSQTERTNAEGVYRFDSLPPGTYSLTAAAPGFYEGEVNNVELREGEGQTRDAKLEVQGPQETVEVEAEGGTVVSAVSGGAMLVLPKDPLVLAAYRDDLKAVKELLEVGADVNAVDEGTDTTALMEAVEHGNAEMVLTLLGAGADVNLRDNAGRTALMALTDDTSADVARTLLSAGARVNLKDRYGNTALMQAATGEKEDVLRVLLEAGAKVNASNSDGQTALMAAAREGKLENVKALLAAGSDLNKKDSDGATALKLARDGEHEEVVGLLVAYGAAEE